MRFAFGNQQGRVPVTSTGLPFFVTDSFKPARARLIEGETELLPGLDIVIELDIAVEYGIKRFMFGRAEVEMTTFNEKHHWVFPLVPTAGAYAKLDDYFGKCENRKLMSGMCRGGFRGPFGISESEQNRKSTFREEMGKSEAIISDMKDTTQNTFVGMPNAPSGSEGAEIASVELRDVEIVSSGW